MIMSTRKKTMLVAIGGLVLVLVPLFLAIFWTEDSGIVPEDTEISIPADSSISVLDVEEVRYRERISQDNILINNYDEYVKNIPINERTIIQNVLYDTIAMNYTGGDPATIKDVQIREESYRQDYDGSYFSTSYILDVKSIKQSYQVYHSWSMIEELNKTSYRYLVLCPEQKDLLFDEFECTDSIKTVRYGS
jgi:hypothetical protein